MELYAVTTAEVKASEKVGNLEYWQRWNQAKANEFGLELQKQPNKPFSGVIYGMKTLNISMWKTPEKKRQHRGEVTV
jgi:hypothetical protein